MTVVMKIDLVGPERRGLALGLNEAAGYGGVALAAGAQRLAGRRVRRPRRARRRRRRRSPSSRSLVSVLFVRDTAAHVALEQARASRRATSAPPSLREAFADATWREPALRACSQAGLVNNLNDALAWGLVPLFLAAHGAERRRDRPRRRHLPGRLGRRRRSATGHWSDRVGRKPLIVAGMLLQAGALGAARRLRRRASAIAAAAAVAARRRHRARLPDADRRDLRRRLARRPRARRRRLPLLARHGLRGRRPDRRRGRRRLGYGGAIAVVAALTAASGLWVLADLPGRAPAQPTHGVRWPS